MYAGVIAVPLVVGTALKLSFADITLLIAAGILVSGLATLIQTIGVGPLGVRLPIVQGTSFGAVATMITIGAQEGGGPDGLRAIFGAIIVAAAIAFFLAPWFSRMMRLFPPVVTGTVITIIGVSLLPVAIRWARGTPGTEDYGAPKNVLLAAGTLFFIMAVYRFLPGVLSRVAILLGLVVGTLVAIPLGFTDFSPVGDADIVGVASPLHFGAPTFELAAIVSMLVVMLVIMTETTADILAIGEVVEKEQTPGDVARGLRADMFSTTGAALLNGFPCTAFAQNVGLVAVTGVRSRWVVATGGGILVLLGLFPVLSAVVAAIPMPVLGGAGIVLFGTVAASGIRTLSKVDYGDNANTVIVAVSLGIGLIPIAVPDFYAEFPQGVATVLGSGISAGAIFAVGLNLLFNRYPTALDTPEPILSGGGMVSDEQFATTHR
jgi:xanthine permease